MFLLLSKTLDVFLQPLTWALLLCLWACLVLWRRPERRRRALFLVALAVGVLVVFSLDPLANLLTRATEEHVDTRRPGIVYDAAIVLGGMLDVDASVENGALSLTDPIERLVAAAELYRAGAVRQVLISGGNVSGEGPPEAQLLGRQLERWGVPADAIVVEGESRNTKENAEQSARIVAAHGWKSLLLLTSASHMPRALDAFRRAGLVPDALAVDFHSHANHVRAAGLLPRVENLARSSSALRELAGRLVYRLRG